MDRLQTLPSLKPGETFDEAVPLTNTAEPSDPKAIELVSFTAAWQPSGVQVNWLTSAEFEIYGFQLYRSADGDRGNAVLITPEIIASQGLDGGLYSFIDTTAEPGVTYTYWIAAVDLDGNAVDYSEAIAVAFNNWLYLPLVSR